MGNNNYAEQSGRRAFYSTLNNGAPASTYIHTLAITIKVIIHSLLNQNPIKGTNLNNWSELNTQQYMQVYKRKIFVLDQVQASLYRI